MADKPAHLYPVNARWRRFVNDEEKQRLATLEVRLSFKRASLEELISERHKIMRRAIMRMRRSKGEGDD